VAFPLSRSRAAVLARVAPPRDGESDSGASAIRAESRDANRRHHQPLPFPLHTGLLAGINNKIKVLKWIA